MDSGGTRTSRFDEAGELIEHAKRRRQQLVPYYEQALAARNASFEMRIRLAEIVTHLRTALDYCASEVYQLLPRRKAHANPRVEFPIRKPGSRELADSCSWFPSLRKSSPAVAGILSGCQSAWLWRLHSLRNANLHDRLTYAEPGAARTLVLGGAIAVREGGDVTIENVSLRGHLIQDRQTITVDNPPHGFTGSVELTSEPCFRVTFGTESAPVWTFLDKTFELVEGVVTQLRALTP